MRGLPIFYKVTTVLVYIVVTSFFFFTDWESREKEGGLLLEIEFLDLIGIAVMSFIISGLIANIIIMILFTGRSLFLSHK